MHEQGLIPYLEVEERITKANISHLVAIKNENNNRDEMLMLTGIDRTSGEGDASGAYNEVPYNKAALDWLGKNGLGLEAAKERWRRLGPEEVPTLREYFSYVEIGCLNTPVSVVSLLPFFP